MGVLLLFGLVLLVMAFMAVLTVAYMALSVGAIHYSRGTTAYRLVWLPALIIACYCGAEGFSAPADMSTLRFGSIYEMGGISAILIQLTWGLYFLPSYPSIAYLVWCYPRRDFDRPKSIKEIAVTLTAMLVTLLLVWLGSGFLTWSDDPVSRLPLRYLTCGVACGVTAALVGIAWFRYLRLRRAYWLVWVPWVVFSIALAYEATTLIANDEQFELVRMFGPEAKSIFSWGRRGNWLINWSCAVAAYGWLIGLVAFFPGAKPTAAS